MKERDESTTMWSRRRKAAVVVFIVAFAVYAGTLAGGFVYDDLEIVLNNPWIRDIRNLYLAFVLPDWAFMEESHGSNYYRPFMIVLFTLGYHLFGLKAWGFHLMNVLLHSFNAVLVYLIAGVLLQGQDGRDGEDRSSSWIVPLAAALVFALHTSNSEPVAWVSSGGADLTFASFALLSFWLYTGAGRVRYALSVLFFACAVTAKETAMFLPVMVFVYDRLWRARGAEGAAGGGDGALRGRWVGYLPFVAVAAGYVALRSASIGGAIFQKQVELTLYESLINVFPIMAKYVGKVLLPVGLNALYVYEPVRSIAEPRALFALLLVVSIGFAAFLARRKREVLFSLLWIFVPLVPVLYIPALQTASFADRYLYVSTAGFGFLTAYGLGVLLKRGGWVRAASLASFAVVLVLYAAGSVTRSMVWKDDYTLWSDTVRRSPGSASAHYNLASTIHAMGDKRKAVVHYLDALRLDPLKANAHYNLALAYQDLGENLKAIEHYERAIDLGYRLEEAHYNAAAAYIAFGNLERAVFHYGEALRLNPGNENAHYNLAWTYERLGDPDRAAAQYREVVALNPRSVDARYNLGRIYLEKGLADEAIGEFEGVLRIRPGDFDAEAGLERARRLKGAK
ncbi:MAG: tetratricopeptide repeat protein [Thermodesulfobacteriota bacterium]